MLEQFALNLLGQFAPNRGHRFSQRLHQRSDAIVDVARALIRAFAPIDDLDRLDDFAGVGLGPLRSRGNQELGRRARARFLRRTTKHLFELQLAPSPSLDERI